MTDLIWSFSPWMTFLFVGRFTNLWGSLAAAGLVALIVFGRAVVRHKVHMLDLAGVAYFAALTTVLVVVHPGDMDTWGRFAQAGSHGLVTLLVFGSVLIGRPFTESYAREKAPEAVWRTSRFHAFNRDISLAWGLAFLVGAMSMILAGAVDHAQLILRLGVPAGAMLCAFKYTQERAGQMATALTPAR
jgi:hypothetical protein